MLRRAVSKSSVTSYSSSTEHPTLPGQLCATLMARSWEVSDLTRRPAHGLLGAPRGTLLLSYYRHSTSSLTSPSGLKQARKASRSFVGLWMDQSGRGRTSPA